MMNSALSDVLEGRARWCVIQGDSLEVLRTIPDECVDAVITDPPYSSGGQFRSDRNGGTASNSCDYAWFVWGPGRGGKWARLDGAA